MSLLVMCLQSPRPVLRGYDRLAVCVLLLSASALFTHESVAHATSSCVSTSHGESEHTSDVRTCARRPLQLSTDIQRGSLVLFLHSPLT